MRSLAEARIAARKGKHHLSSRLASATLDHARRSQSNRLEISALMCLAGANAATERLAVAEQRVADAFDIVARSEEHTPELHSLMRNSYAVFCMTQKITQNT